MGKPDDVVQGLTALGREAVAFWVDEVQHCDFLEGPMGRLVDRAALHRIHGPFPFENALDTSFEYDPVRRVHRDLLAVRDGPGGVAGSDKGRNVELPGYRSH